MDMEHGGQYSTDGDYGYSPYEQGFQGMVYTSAVDVVCYNCGPNHFVSECKAPMCVGCRQKWPTTNPATGYHHPFHCPTNPLRIRRPNQSFGGQGRLLPRCGLANHLDGDDVD